MDKLTHNLPNFFIYSERHGNNGTHFDIYFILKGRPIFLLDMCPVLFIDVKIQVQAFHRGCFVVNFESRSRSE